MSTLKKKKLVIFCFYWGPKLGVGVYLDSLLPLVVSQLKDIYEIELICNKNFLEKFKGNIPTGIKVRTPFLLSKNFAAIIFCLCFYRRNSVLLYLTNPVLSLLPSTSISVIHDLNEYEVPEKFGIIRRLYRRNVYIKRALKKSDHVIVISKHVKEQIKKYTSYDIENKITIIHNGVNIDKKVFTRKEVNNFFLIVGRIDPVGKNLYEAISLFNNINKVKSSRLIIVGGINNSSKHQALEFIDELKYNKNIEYKGFVSDDELKELYLKSCACIFLSKSEGFGFPVLEAFSYGCPVITHIENTVVNEIGGGLTLVLTSEEIERNKTVFKVVEYLSHIDKEKLITHSQNFDWIEKSEEYCKTLVAYNSY